MNSWSVQWSQATRARNQRRVSPLVIVVGVLVLGVLADPGELQANDWPGWRGLEIEASLASGQGPLGWSESEAMWSVEIPGDGYSSPIVWGDTVFLTTSYPTARGEAVLWSLNLFSLLLCLAVVSLLNAWLISQALGGRPVWKHPRAIGLELLALALVTFVLFGKSMLDYSGTGDVRSWLSGGLGVSICLMILAACTSSWGRHRRYTISLMVSYAVIHVAIVPMPLRKHLLSLESLRSVRLSDALVALSIPVALVGGAAFLALWTKRAKNGGSIDRGNEMQTEGGTAGAKLLAAVAIVKTVTLVLGFGSLWLLYLGASSSGYLSQHLGAGLELEPTLGWWSVWVFGGLYLVLAVGLVLRASGLGAVPGTDSRLLVALLLLAMTIVVLTNFLNTTTQLSRVVLAVDRASGGLLWVTEDLPSPIGQMNTFNSAATPTPVTDGERVYAYFGSAGLLATTLAGDVAWRNTQHQYDNVYGTVVSPVVAEGVLVLVLDTPENPYVVGLDATSGLELWRQERSARGLSFNGASRTPIVKRIDDRSVLFVWGERDLRAYDLHTGALLRNIRVRVGGSDRVASPTSDSERIYLVGKRRAIAVDLQSRDESNEAPAWTSERIAGPNCSSPVLANGLIFSVSDWGNLLCLDAATGKVVWEHELEGEFYSSPVAIGGHVYVTDTSGVTTIFSAARQFSEISKGQLSGRVFASAAISDGTFYVRTDTHLHAFSRKGRL